MERSEEGWGRGVGWWGKVWAWKPDDKGKINGVEGGER